MSALLKKITFWRVITLAVIAAGLYAAYLRFFIGWQASTNLTDAQPWGIWVGINTLCGVGLSAGGFAIAGAVYLLGMERYRPVLRASILISFLGYSSVCAGYLYELGLPWRMWHPMIFWNKASVLFDVALCVMSYTTLLMIEFAPSVIEKLPWKKLREPILHYHHKIAVGIVLAGVLLSSMHQSFLGGLFLLTKGRMYPLWYSPYLHTMFFMTAIPAGLAVVIIAMYLSMRSLNARIDYSILTDIAKVIVPMLVLFGVFRIINLIAQDAIQYVFAPRIETLYFWLEMVLLVIAPVVLFSMKRVRNNPVYLYWTASILAMGFITHRANVSIVSMEWSNHANYVPKWSELALTVLGVAVAIIAFRWCVLKLDIFPRAKQERWMSSPAEA